MSWGIINANNPRSVPTEVKSKLIQLRQSGVSSAEIARQFGLPQSTVSSICSRAGVLPRRRPVNRPAKRAGEFELLDRLLQSAPGSEAAREAMGLLKSA